LRILLLVLTASKTSNAKSPVYDNYKHHNIFIFQATAETIHWSPETRVGLQKMKWEKVTVGDKMNQNTQQATFIQLANEKIGNCEDIVHYWRA
jgi:hypothetical protein